MIERMQEQLDELKAVKAEKELRSGCLLSCSCSATAGCP